MKLDFNYDSVREVEVSVYQEPVWITSAILVTEQVSTMNRYGSSAAMHHSINVRAFVASEPTVSVPLLFQSTSIGAPMLVLGAYLPPGHEH